MKDLKAFIKDVGEATELISKVNEGKNTDEIMTAVNSKSIVSEGTDINGISYPVYLRGWGGQSVALLYIMSIFMKIFGYTEVDILGKVNYTKRNRF